MYRCIKNRSNLFKKDNKFYKVYIYIFFLMYIREMLLIWTKK